MHKLIALLKAGETPWGSIYLRVLALTYLGLAGVHFAGLLDYGDVRLEKMTATAKTVSLIYGQIFAIGAVGLWMRRPWGVGLFFLIAFSQLAVYAGFPELIATTDKGLQTLQGFMNYHISTLAIFALIRIQGR